MKIMWSLRSSISNHDNVTESISIRFLFACISWSKWWAKWTMMYYDSLSRQGYKWFCVITRLYVLLYDHSQYRFQLLTQSGAKWACRYMYNSTRIEVKHIIWIKNEWKYMYYKKSRSIFKHVWKISQFYISYIHM